MKFTVRDLLKLDVLNSLEIVAGEEGLDKEVTNVTVLDAPDAIGWLRGGEFVITSLYPFKGKEDQKRLMESLAQKNASALGIKLKRFVFSLSEEVIALANSYRLPLIHIPLEKAWIDLINPIMAEIMNRQYVILEESKNIRHSFVKTVLEGGNLQSIAELLFQFTNNPVTIVDLVDGHLISWPYYFKGHISLEKTFRMGESSTFVESTIHGEITGQIFPIEVAKKREGLIIIWLINGLKEIDYIAIQHANTVAALYIQQLRAVNEVNQRFRDDFINQLVKGQFSYAYAQKKAHELDWEMKNEGNVVLVMKILWQGENDWRKSYHVFHYVKDFIKRNTSLEIPMAMDGGHKIIFLIPKQSGEGELDGGGILEEIRRAQKEITKNRDQLKMVIGMGNPCDSIAAIPQSYQEAKTALHIALSLERDFLQYEELGPYTLLVKLLKYKETTTYLKKYIDPIIQYDKKNKASILQTLEAFVESGGSYRKTAKKLFVHHNTVRYRLRCIESLLGVRFKEADILLHFMLALKLHHLRGGRGIG